MLGLRNTAIFIALISLAVVGLLLYLRGVADQELVQMNERLLAKEELLERINDATDAETRLNACIAAQLSDGLPVQWDFRTSSCVEH